MRKEKLIALLLAPAYESNRNVMRGIMRYAKPHRRWQFAMAASPEQAARLQPDGVIGILGTREIWRRLRVLRCPLVQVFGHCAGLPIARVDIDDLAVGALAAEHFLERNLRHFGFFSTGSSASSTLRMHGFSRTLADGGFSVAKSEQSGPALLRWLRTLPKPCGIFAETDAAALIVSDACARAGLAVPEQVAILGVDDDELFCNCAYPQLSSISTPTEEVGYLAARQLDRLLRRNAPSKKPLLLQPLGINTRRSTDVSAVDDADVRAALQLLRRHFRRRVSVAELLREIPVSRRTLEYKFRRVLGRSPLQELTRLRVDHARRLLLYSTLRPADVARQSGYSSSDRLGAVLRQKLGLSTHVLRRQNP